MSVENDGHILAHTLVLSALVAGSYQTVDGRQKLRDSIDAVLRDSSTVTDPQLAEAAVESIGKIFDLAGRMLPGQ